MAHTPMAQTRMAGNPMAQAPHPDRRLRGFEPAAGLVRDQIRGAGEKRGFAVSRLLTHWDEIVGPDLGRITRPAKVGWGREGMGATLTLLVAPAAAPQVQMELPRIRDRVNATYGYAAIARIVLTQTAASGFAEGQTPFTAAPPGGQNRGPMRPWPHGPQKPRRA
jgi:hypothetical protein